MRLTAAIFGAVEFSVENDGSDLSPLLKHLSFWSFDVSAEGLTGAGLDKPSLRGVKGGKVVVFEVGEEEAETGPNSLPRNWMPSWRHTRPRCVLDFAIIF